MQQGIIIARQPAAPPHRTCLCSNHDLNIVWRLSYGLGLFPIFFMLCWRLFRLKESKVWLRKRSSLKSLGEL